jgi:glc operon protein GlcG
LECYAPQFRKLRDPPAMHRRPQPDKGDTMLAHFRFAAAAFASCLLAASATMAQVPVYGANVTLEQARKAIAAGQAEARKNSWPVAIAIVDNAGQLVAFEKMDNTQTASVEVAQDKAVSAAIYRRSTKVVQDGLAGGGAGLRLLALRGMSPVEGGLPLIVDGKIIGGIGVSGVNSDQDGVVAKAGGDAVAAK